MFFRRKDDIYDDDDYEEKKIDLSKYKLPLIILGGIILLIVIIFIISKFVNKNGIAYEDKLYYITLEGDTNITIYVGDIYNELGYIGRDDEGNDLTSDVVVINNIDTSVVGNYKVSYTLGNVTKERIVKVIEKPVGATKIYLYGDMNVFLYVGEEYIEKYYEVVDTVDGAKLKDKVTIKSNVDTSKEGIYKVIYSVVNSSGVTTTEERTVIVMDRELSLIPNTTDITNNNITINIYSKDEFFDYLILPNGNKTTERTAKYEVSSNGTYKFVMYNNKGESKEKSITISNIDKESPTGSCSGYYQNGTSQINVSAKDNVGISRYVINGTSYTINTIRINSELASVNVVIYDKAGNNTNISCNLENKNPTSAPSSSSSQSSPSSSSSSKGVTDIDFVDTEHYCANNKIRTTQAAKIDTTNLGCELWYGDSQKDDYIRANYLIADNLHAILTNVCSYVNSVSWMTRLQHAGVYAGGTPGEANLHGYGLAIDLNNQWSYTSNGKTYRPYASMGRTTWSNYQKFICEVCDGKEDCQYNVNYIIFKRYFQGNGWCWGGNWGPDYFDPMHFEIRDNNECLTKNKQQVKC